jgi:hypothetical protein
MQIALPVILHPRPAPDLARRSDAKSEFGRPLRRAARSKTPAHVKRRWLCAYYGYDTAIAEPTNALPRALAHWSDLGMTYSHKLCEDPDGG